MGETLGHYPFFKFPTSLTLPSSLRYAGQAAGQVANRKSNYPGLLSTTRAFESSCLRDFGSTNVTLASTSKTVLMRLDN